MGMDNINTMLGHELLDKLDILLLQGTNTTQAYTGLLAIIGAAGRPPRSSRTGSMNTHIVRTGVVGLVGQHKINLGAAARQRFGKVIACNA